MDSSNEEGPLASARGGREEPRRTKGGRSPDEGGEDWGGEKALGAARTQRSLCRTWRDSPTMTESGLALRADANHRSVLAAKSESLPEDKRGMAPSYSDDDFVIEGDEPRELRRPLEGADAPLENYRKLHVPRRRLARWCNLPNFDEAVTGFYVLVRTDRDGAAGRSARQLCRIEGVRRGEEYGLPPSVGGPSGVTTDRHLLLAFGRRTSTVGIARVSDERPTAE